MGESGEVNVLHLAFYILRFEWPMCMVTTVTKNHQGHDESTTSVVAPMAIGVVNLKGLCDLVILSTYTSYLFPLDNVYEQAFESGHLIF